MTVSTGLEDEERPTGEVPALPTGFGHPAAHRSVPKDLRYELVAA
ncbi:hypothetical protein [Cellulomonas humilata]|nr:hypothetical protein [Cellulomonas humilata]